MEEYLGMYFNVCGIIKRKLERHTNGDMSTVSVNGYEVFAGSTKQAYKEFDKALVECCKDARGCGIPYEILEIQGNPRHENIVEP